MNVGKKRFTSKTYLKVLIVVGLLAVVGGGAGTFATFNATTTNPATFATGTLVLSNTVNAATACLSTGGGPVTASNTFSCDALFSTTVSKPGDSASAHVTLQNSGSLAASTLSLQASSCVDSNNGAETFHGTGSLCTALHFYVQEWTSSSFATPFKCWYGDVGTTCSPSFTSTLAGFGTSPVDISVGPGSPPALAASGLRYFTVAVELPGSADNTYQGRQAALALTWEESQ